MHWPQRVYEPRRGRSTPAGVRLHSGDDMSPSNDPRWRETADVATRIQYPEEYWCVADDGWVQYFWADQTVSREEYLAHSGKGDCA